MTSSSPRIACTTTGLARAILALPVLCSVSLALSDPALARVRHHAARTTPAAAAAQPVWPAKPNGTVILAVSINEQRLTIWDDGVVVARSPVSTGVPGHLTPRGIFSVLQKQKFHRSNLYSAAPMPFMQRITWSGVALHEGHVTGHPASHGCIRLPREVAIKLFGYTSMGARVVITNEPITPVAFSHPKLFAAQTAPDKSAGDLPSSGAHAAQLAETPASVSAAEASDAQSAPPAPAPEVQAQAKPEAAPDVAAQAPATAAASEAAPALAATPEVAQPGPAVAETPAAPATAAPATAAVSPAPASTAAPAAAPAPAPIVATAPRRTGHVAMFVSAREGKLIVRQGFEPVYEAAVTIAEPGRPLGTHLYTAMQVKPDDGSVRWSSLSLPDAPAPAAAPRARKGEPAPAAPLAVAQPSSAAEALDRISIPDEARQRVAELMSAGASLVISDQGFGSETGKHGTDFIVVTR